MKDYKKLIVWQKSHANVLMIYNLTKSFPSEERFGITSQIRRAAASVPTNIAEGCGKFTERDFAQYLQISLGSTQETEYLCYLSFELGYLREDQFNQAKELINEIKAMLITLIKKIRIQIKH